ncbi:MAG: hypothetical protein OHK0053_27310 [Microscillaceae bacterium]
MKKLFILIIFIQALCACGGGRSQEAQDTAQVESKETTQEANNGAEVRLCFASEAQLTKAYANFIIKGNIVTGTLQYVTPKAGMTLFELCDVNGTKEGNQLKLTLSTVDTDTGQGIGETREENWILKGDVLTQEQEDVVGALSKIVCDEDASFKAEAPKDGEAQSYELDGVMDGKIKIKMHLSARPNPEDKKTTLFEGYYYYLSQGKDKKIDLKGIANTMGFLPLEEVVDGKTFGKFMIDQSFNIGEGLECIWISADGKKEMQTVLKPSE